MKAETMCEYTRDEFERGMRELGCDGAAKLRAKLGTLRGSLSDTDTFRAVYAWVFDFAKDSPSRFRGAFYTHWSLRVGAQEPILGSSDQIPAPFVAGVPERRGTGWAYSRCLCSAFIF